MDKLFGRAGAVVMERGGPLTHAAIDARELGIPAVLGVRGVVDAVTNGTELRVDGDAATVEVVASGQGDDEEHEES